MPYYCSTCQKEHETGEVCKEVMLVQAEGFNWRSCEEDHPRILHREKFCPVCAKEKYPFDGMLFEILIVGINCITMRFINPETGKRFDLLWPKVMKVN